MNAQNFAYWLRGYMEISQAGNKNLALNEDQVKCINDHLDLVMTKKTPDRSEQQEYVPQPGSDQEYSCNVLWSGELPYLHWNNVSC
jgi:hypothetical protein